MSMTFQCVLLLGIDHSGIPIWSRKPPIQNANEEVQTIARHAPINIIRSLLA